MRQLDPRPGSAHCTGKPRGARGGTQGGLNCLTHALPRCLPTPNSVEADGGRGRSAVAGRRGPLGRRLERVTALVPLLLTGVPDSHPPGRTDKNLCIFRCPGLPGFP